MQKAKDERSIRSEPISPISIPPEGQTLYARNLKTISFNFV